MDDELERGRVPAEQSIDPVAIADVEVDAGERVELALEPRRHPGGRGIGPEEACPHVVVDAHDVVAVLDEVAGGLGADQTA